MATTPANLLTRLANASAELAASDPCDTVERRMALWEEFKCYCEIQNCGILDELESGTIGVEPFEVETIGIP